MGNRQRQKRGTLGGSLGDTRRLQRLATDELALSDFISEGGTAQVTRNRDRDVTITMHAVVGSRDLMAKGSGTVFGDALTAAMDILADKVEDGIAAQGGKFVAAMRRKMPNTLDQMYEIYGLEMPD